MTVFNYIYIPEFFLFLSSCIFWIYSLSTNSVRKRLDFFKIILYLLFIILFIFFYFSKTIDVQFYEDSFISSRKILLIKLIVILLLILLVKFFEFNLIIFPSEFFFFLLWNIFGLFLILISRNLLALFFSMELYSSTLILLMYTPNNKENINGKVFFFYIFNSIFSIVMLFGIWLIYYVTNSISYLDLHFFFSGMNLDNSHFKHYYILVLAMLLILISFFFKFGLVPFHFWMPLLFKNLPMFTVGYVSIITKLPLFFFFNYFFLDLVNFFFNELFWIISFVTILSSLLSLFRIYYETNLKVLVFYISLVSFSFIFFTFTHTQYNVYKISLIYLIIYSFFLLLIFSILLFFENLNLITLFDLVKLKTFSSLSFILINIFFISLLMFASFPLTILFTCKFIVLLDYQWYSLLGFCFIILINLIILFYLYIKILILYNISNYNNIKLRILPVSYFFLISILFVFCLFSLFYQTPLILWFAAIF